MTLLVCTYILRHYINTFTLHTGDTLPCTYVDCHFICQCSTYRFGYKTRGEAKTKWRAGYTRQHLLPTILSQQLASSPSLVHVHASVMPHASCHSLAMSLYNIMTMCLTVHEMKRTLLANGIYKQSNVECVGEGKRGGCLGEGRR